MSEDKNMMNNAPSENENSQQYSLNDDRRVRTLSPGALVARRFLRNRVAVTGLVILAFMFVFSFIGGYNSYVWPSLVLKTKSKFLVSQGLQLFFVAEGAYGLKWGAIMAACTVIVVPLFVLFAFCEKYIVAGISSDSAVKE